MKFRPSLFWDTNPDKIDVQKNAPYIIERILELGRDEEVRWMWSFYNKDLIEKVINKSRSLRLDTKHLWTLILKS